MANQTLAELYQAALKALLDARQDFDSKVNLIQTLQNKVSTLETEVRQYQQDIVALKQKTQKVSFDGARTRIEAGSKYFAVENEGNVVVNNNSGTTYWDTGTQNDGSRISNLEQKVNTVQGTATDAFNRSSIIINGEISIEQNKRFGFALTDKFTLDNLTMGHYSLGWFGDSWSNQGATAWFSAWAGIKMFTQGSTRFSIDIDGNILYSVSMNKSSSRELKANITHFPTKDAFEILDGLVPVNYNLKADGVKRLHIGFIAEDVPKAVASHGGKAISNDNITAVLTKVVKEQQKTISVLQKEVDLLKNQN
jgi:hypothetical protein